MKRLIPATERERALDLWRTFMLNYLPGKELQASVEEFVEERTTKQRNALFGVAYTALADQMGLSGSREKDDLHEFMLGEYFGWREKAVMGAIRRYPVRTTTTNEHGDRDVLSVRQQMAFYAWLQKRAANYGYDVPDPDPEWFRKAEREAELEEQAKRYEPDEQTADHTSWAGWLKGH